MSSSSSPRSSGMPRYLSRRAVLPILISIPIMLGLLLAVGLLVGPIDASRALAFAKGQKGSGVGQAVLDVVADVGGQEEQAIGSRRVKVDLSVMSRCPDAVSRWRLLMPELSDENDLPSNSIVWMLTTFCPISHPTDDLCPFNSATLSSSAIIQFVCEATMDKVLSHPGVREKIELRMNYIGSPDSRATYGVECKHGDIECAGNIHQLCVQEHVRTSVSNETMPPHKEAQGDRSTLPAVWNFIQAQNYYEPRRIGELEYAKRCAVAAGIDWDESGVSRCVERAGSGRSGGKDDASDGEMTDEDALYETDEEDLEAYEDDVEAPPPRTTAQSWLDWFGSLWGSFGLGGDSSRSSTATKSSHRSQGERLLLASAQRVHQRLKAPKSCTILIEEKVRCIHDGSWYQCDVSARVCRWSESYCCCAYVADGPPFLFNPVISVSVSGQPQDGHEPADIARSIHDVWKSLNE